jgi:hypothetical protein
MLALSVFYAIVLYIVIQFCWNRHNAILAVYVNHITDLKAELDRVQSNYDALLAIRQSTKTNGEKKTGQLTLIPDHLVDKTQTYRSVVGNDGCTYKIAMGNLQKLESGLHYVTRHYEELTHKNRWHNGKNKEFWVDTPAKDYIYTDSYTRYWEDSAEYKLYELAK